MSLDFMMTFEDHGGGCCGIRHISEFPDDEDLRDEFNVSRVKLEHKLKLIDCHVQRCIKDQGDKGVAVEAVLAKYQFRFWERALQRYGFRKVFEFLNSNSGNICRVYYYCPGNQPNKGEAND
jgi:hypothetical protein